MRAKCNKPTYDTDTGKAMIFLYLHFPLSMITPRIDFVKMYSPIHFINVKRKNGENYINISNNEFFEYFEVI